MVGLARKWMVGAITPKVDLYFLGISGKELKELCDASNLPLNRIGNSLRILVQ